MNNFEKVIEFNKSFGLPHYDLEQKTILSDNIKLSNLRVDLCVEEIKELNEAFEEHNFIEVIDALTDELYVIYGAASSFGININKEFRNKYNVIESIIKETNYEIIRKLNVNNRETIDKDFFLRNKSDDPKIYGLLQILNNIADDLVTHKNNKNFLKVKETLVMLLYYTYFMGIELGINLNESFTIVHNSNMSKLCNDEDESKITLEWYNQNDTRYDSPNYRPSDDNKYWVIYNESTGKILKNVNYTSANFETMLN